MPMHIHRHIARMKRNADTIQYMVRGISYEQAQWKPAPDSWSILEVINHLHDEEREDFRPRLDLILHNPNQPLQKIDPVGWVNERQYNQRGLDASLLKFMDERRESLRWLGTLQSPNWDAVYQMPWGPMTAGDMFASWITHDMLHSVRSCGFSGCTPARSWIRTRSSTPVHGDGRSKYMALQKPSVRSLAVVCLSCPPFRPCSGPSKSGCPSAVPGMRVTRM